jgi:hypothetical protein
MPTSPLTLTLALLVPGLGLAEPEVRMPSVGFSYTTQIDADTTLASGSNAKTHSVIHHKVVASDGTTVRTRNEGTIGGSGGEVPILGTTIYRLFLPIDTETTARAAPDQPPVTNGTTLDCPADRLDKFYPRGNASQVSLACQATGKIGGQAVGPIPVTVSFYDLGTAHDKTRAGTFDVRKLVARTTSAESRNEFTFDFAPAVGISVVQEEGLDGAGRDGVAFRGHGDRSGAMNGRPGSSHARN